MKTTFSNQKGAMLDALLDMPAGQIRAFALFAHCFTCSKNISATSRISRALTAHGIAVLRFDFTGLGNSEGDFANTNFSSNIQDLISAAEFLAKEYQAPSLLIGHSLGGAAALVAAQSIDSVRAIVTLASPATAQHLHGLLVGKADHKMQNGELSVQLGSQRFSIRQQFLDDINTYNDASHIGSLNKALLVLHSPNDRIVPIDEAAKIYQAAKHPKSFVSLDDSDHLLSSKEDAQYAAEVIAAWVSRYLPVETEFDSDDIASTLSDGEVFITEENHRFLRGIYTKSHYFQADEPASFGGDAQGPNPYDLLLASLGACTSMTLRMYATHKNLPLKDIRVTLRHKRVHCEDSADCPSKHGYIDQIERSIQLQGELTQAQRDRLFEIAERCPVHKTLKNHIAIISRLI